MPYGIKCHKIPTFLLEKLESKVRIISDFNQPTTDLGPRLCALKGKIGLGEHNSIWYTKMMETVWSARFTVISLIGMSK